MEEVGGAYYWLPKPTGSSAEVTYQFQFARPVQRAHLQLPIYCVDIPSTTNGPLRCTFAIESSADGKQWHSIYNGLGPPPQWGEGTEQRAFVAEIPKSALGQPALWLRVRLQSEGGKAQLSGAQLGRAPNGENENWKT